MMLDPRSGHFGRLYHSSVERLQIMTSVAVANIEILPGVRQIVFRGQFTPSGALGFMMKVEGVDVVNLHSIPTAGGGMGQFQVEESDMVRPAEIHFSSQHRGEQILLWQYGGAQGENGIDLPLVDATSFGDSLDRLLDDWVEDLKEKRVSPEALISRIVLLMKQDQKLGRNLVSGLSDRLITSGSGGLQILFLLFHGWEDQ